MNLNYLDFEQPMAEFDEKINALAQMDSDADLSKELTSLRAQSNKLLKKTFANLSDWQITQVARHPRRLYTLDYLPDVFDDFTELHGDNVYGDDRAIIGGIATLEGVPVMFIGQQKGRTTAEKILHNFGMPRPEGYRKALKLMRLAEKFKLPIITFIDTPGAYPGIGAEERGQSESIARNLAVMPTLKVPIISVIIGEGGSGGALAIGVADKVLMFEYSIYSVISPEGCASILYKDASKASLASEHLKLTSRELCERGLIDHIIKEPLGGIHADPESAKKMLKSTLIEQLKQLQLIDTEALLSQRIKKILNFGEFSQ